MKQRLKNAIGTYFFLLFVTLALAGCGSGADTPDTSTVSQSQAGQTNQSAPVSSAPATADMDYSSQLQLIADNAAVWMGDTELTAEPYFYAVTDLDQNGRLEIIQSSCQGTGLYTYSNFWEVSADGSELVPCQFSVDEGDSQPDIIADPEAVYFDEANNQYFYIFSDDIRNGAAEYYQSRIAVSLQDGVVAASPLCQSHSVYSSDSSVVTTYADAGGNNIDEDTYNMALDKAFAGLKSMKAAIGWTDYDVSEQLAAMSSTELTALLKNSWEGFSLI